MVLGCGLSCPAAQLQLLQLLAYLTAGIVHSDNALYCTELLVLVRWEMTDHSSSASSFRTRAFEPLRLCCPGSLALPQLSVDLPRAPLTAQ